MEEKQADVTVWSNSNGGKAEHANEGRIKDVVIMKPTEEVGVVTRLGLVILLLTWFYKVD